MWPATRAFCGLQVWDDGTLAAPLAALKEDASDRSPGAERGAAAADAADPDFSLQNEQTGSDDGRASAGRGGGGHAAAQGGGQHSGGSHRGGGGGHGADSGGDEYLGEAAYSDDSPRASV